MNKDNSHFFEYRSFKATIFLISFALITALVAEIGVKWGRGPQGVLWIGIAVAVLAVLSYLIGFFKPLKKLIDTPAFAVSILLFIGLGTALGTFITQNTPYDVFVGRYGESMSRVLYQLRLNDVFHSWWYIALFILLAISLIRISSKRKFDIAHLGFHLAHLSPLIILFGFWLDFFEGYRGMIKLEVGNSSSEVTMYRGQTNYTGGIHDLGFQVRLDTFDFEKFKPDYKLQIWEQDRIIEKTEDKNGEIKERKLPNVLASHDLTPGKWRKIYGTDIMFQLVEFYPNFHFKYIYPENMDTIAEVDPGMVMEVHAPGGEQIVKMSANDDELNNISDPHFTTNLRFFWNLPEGLRDSLTQGLRPGSFDEGDWLIVEGKPEKIYELTGAEVSVSSIDKDRYYILSPDPDIGFYLLQTYPDPKYLDAVPSSRNDDLDKPVAKILVSRDSYEAPKEAFVFPTKGQKFGFYLIPNTKFFLALESMKHRETKFWKSSLSMLDEEGNVKYQGAVKVNEPVKYKGHRFYQTDFDPDNPNYSGIGVSREPGLNIIYTGFVLLVLGVFLMLYVKNDHQHPDNLNNHNS